MSRRAIGMALASLVATCALSTPGYAQSLWNQTIDNDIRGTILGVEKTYDPADPLQVSGTLLDNSGVNCHAGDPVANLESGIVTVHPVTPGTGLTGGHGNCTGEKSWSYSVATIHFGGEEGDFSFMLGGGGVSWLTGSGVANLGSWVEVEFFDDACNPAGHISCGNSGVYSVLPGCANSPEIYGAVASPDLNGTGMVDGSDLAVLTSLFLGHHVTLESGWQADFNHLGPNVDASDLAYFAGRMGKLCLEGQQKAGAPSYQMDVENLDREDVRSVMAEHGISVAQILAAWESMGFSYDREAAATILTRDEGGERASSWSRVKTLYR